MSAPALSEMLAQIRDHAPSGTDSELKETFIEAVQHMAHTKADFSEETQRRLFGLFHHAQATSTDKMEDEQKAAIAAESQLSRQQAMRAYIELIEQTDPSFLFDDDSEVPSLSAQEKPASELPSAIMDQLKAAGIKEVSPAEAISAELDVFEAARAGAPLDRHLPAGVHATDDSGLSALHHAVDAEQARAAAALLKAKANPNALDADGSTPLHYAVTVGSLELVTLLLEAGADRALTDEDGNDAAKLAKSQGQADIERLLLSGGPTPSTSASSSAAATTSSAQ